MSSNKAVHNYYNLTTALSSPDDSLFFHDNRFSMVQDSVYRYFGRNKVILDIGCGNGYLTSLVMPDNHVYGLDLSWQNVQKASEKGVVALQHNADTSLPFQDSSFDVIICSEVLEHLFGPENLLAEIYRVLRPGGGAIITVPNLYCLSNRISLLRGAPTYWIEYPTNFEHIRFYSERTLRLILERQRLQIIRITGIGVVASDPLAGRLITLGTLLYRMLALDFQVLKKNHRLHNKKYLSQRLRIERRLGPIYSTLSPELLVVCKKQS